MIRIRERRRTPQGSFWIRCPSQPPTRCSLPKLACCHWLTSCPDSQADAARHPQRFPDWRWVLPRALSSTIAGQGRWFTRRESFAIPDPIQKNWVAQEKDLRIHIIGLPRAIYSFWFLLVLMDVAQLTEYVPSTPWVPSPAMQKLGLVAWPLTSAPGRKAKGSEVRGHLQLQFEISLGYMWSCLNNNNNDKMNIYIFLRVWLYLLNIHDAIF